MGKDSKVPAWLVALVILFSGLTAGFYVSWLYFHSQAASHADNLLDVNEKLDEINSIVLHNAKLRIDSLTEQISIRKQKQTEISSNDQDERNAITNLSSSAQEDYNAILASIAKLQQEYDAVSKRTQTAQDDLITEEQNAVNTRQDHEAQLVNYRSNIEQLGQEIKRIEEQNLKDILKVEIEIRDREARVQELIDRQNPDAEDLISDGKILQSLAAEGFVILNRGLEDDLPQGTRFIVFNRRAGKNIIKGEIEIIEVSQRQSVARVINEANANDPIIPGDNIHNPIYNPDEVKYFVVKGDFKEYSRAELARFIIDAGGRIDQEISERTHYLVAGERAEEFLKQASLNGVTIIDERKLLRYAKRSERFSIRQGMVFSVIGKFTRVDLGTVKQWVTNNGGALHAEITPKTDVLIAGAGAEQSIAAARSVGATVLTEDQISSLLVGARADTDGVGK